MMKSLVVSNEGLRVDDRPAHEVLRREPLRTIPLDAGMHMVVHAKEAKAPEGVNGPAVSILLSCSNLAAGKIPMVDGEAVIVRPDGEVTAEDVTSMVMLLLDEKRRSERDDEIGELP